MAEMIGGLLTSKIHEYKQLHPCYLQALPLTSSHEAELQQSPPTSRSARDLLPYQHETDRRGKMETGMRWRSAMDKVTFLWRFYSGVTSEATAVTV